LNHCAKFYCGRRTGEYSVVQELELEPTDVNEYLDFADVAGQSKARFAAEVAASGGHHLRTYRTARYRKDDDCIAYSNYFAGVVYRSSFLK
jgi:predicted ATPase with chaperone activity